MTSGLPSTTDLDEMRERVRLVPKPNLPTLALSGKRTCAAVIVSTPLLCSYLGDYHGPRQEALHLKGFYRSVPKKIREEQCRATATRSLHRPRREFAPVLGERHFRHLLYGEYHSGVRTHLALNKNAPLTRAVQALGRIVAAPILGGLHHEYVRT